MVSPDGWIWLCLGIMVWILSFALFLVIKSFVKNRPLAMQSSLDLLSQHTNFARLIFITLTLAMELIVIIFRDQLNQYFCVAIYALYCANLDVHSISKTVNMIHRYIMIFKPHWLENMTDDAIVSRAR